MKVPRQKERKGGGYVNNHNSCMYAAHLHASRSPAAYHIGQREKIKDHFLETTGGERREGKEM